MLSQHLLILPVLLPALLAALSLLLGQRLALKRGLALLGGGAMLLLSLTLLTWADQGAIQVYRLGGWQPPFGILLQLDRLSAWMLVLTALLALEVQAYAAVSDWDKRGAFFHELFWLQWMGLNGAFLTGDLFNLFVFFELLLIASYGLLVHGDGRARIDAGLRYVTLNLAGSALFLIAVSLLYGLTGTLNMADMARRVAQAAPGQWPWLRSAALLLFIVFALKAALWPLNAWVRGTYAAAPGPVAALFAIMTKVGVYAIIRVYTLVFGSASDAGSGLLTPWLPWLALGTLLLGSLLALAARSVRGLAGGLVVGSVGMLLFGFAVATPAALAATLYYLPHSTLAVAVLYLLADQLQLRRDAGDVLHAGGVADKHLALLFLLAAVLLAGLPPSAGFLAKLWLLQGLPLQAPGLWLALVLLAALLSMIALARAGSALFWQEPSGNWHAARPGTLLPASALVLMALALSVFAEPISSYCQRMAEQLLLTDAYVEVLR
ncbi:MAG: hypothetical protein RL210_2345 [Pseudomonadota bacterium]|jgi:multicomponent K+:H+ antiporter subunit D|nr:multicomponent antiporter subunit [Pseudomonadota bacterium]